MKKTEYKQIGKQVFYLADPRQDKWLVKETCKNKKAAEALLKELEDRQKDYN